jgi:hypothetical protein
MANQDNIDTGDSVIHIPSGEEWLVAGVDGDRLSACGWPESTAYIKDCKLIKKASISERIALKKDLLLLPEYDHRRRYG